jgi:large subunit ribosomal protein L1
MPNPKSGTAVADVDLPRAIAEVRKGRIEYRTDRTAIIHVPLGKVSFEVDALLENLTAAIEAIASSRPSGSKGQYIKSATLTTSMGPGIKLDLKPIFSK